MLAYESQTCLLQIELLYYTGAHDQQVDDFRRS
jgi:hypothetical protein